MPHVRLAKPLRSLCDLGAEVQNKHEGQTFSERSIEKMLLHKLSTFPLKMRHTIQFLCHGMGDYRQTVITELRSKRGSLAWNFSPALTLALSLCSYRIRMPGPHHHGALGIRLMTFSEDKDSKVARNQKTWGSWCLLAMCYQTLVRGSGTKNHVRSTKGVLIEQRSIPDTVSL